MRHITWQGTGRNGLVWRKSSYSGHQTDCIQVADGHPDQVPVRDSKNPHGPTLLFQTAAWSAFITGLKRGSIPAE
ncbi:DUF397 domain-containing protein [Streptomyces sp. QH1-20]|uniref:DUF397 domain-containing protein n=1 Tax=Streptomyces sp. QH1-20 TaxID=3240934 RepID=UPI0035129534